MEWMPPTGDLLQFRMAFIRVRQASPTVVAQAMQVKPIARDVQANDLRLCYSVHALFLLVRGPWRPQSTVRDDEERRCRLSLSVVMPQGTCAMHRPVAGLRQGRRRERNITVETQKVRGAT